MSGWGCVQRLEQLLALGVVPRLERRLVVEPTAGSGFAALVAVVHEAVDVEGKGGFVARDVGDGDGDGDGGAFVGDLGAG